MKNFKLKMFSLVLGTFMLLSVFTGCSLFVPNNDKEMSKTALVIGEETITKKELSELYYSFYQQNSSYYYYYTEDQILEAFYKSVIANKVSMQEAKKLIAENQIVMTDEDYKDIWKNVFSYVTKQIDSYEKAILTARGAKETDLPKRLQTSTSSDETAYIYKPYEFEPVEYKPATGNQATAPTVADKIIELKEFIYKYNQSEIEDEEDYVAIPDAEKATRSEAYEKFLSSLMLSAKANDKDTNKEVVLKTEIERVYKSYNESKTLEKYQDYINSTSARDDEGYKNYFSDEEIVKKFKELLNASEEGNVVEENYVKVITSTSNETLILYRYDGKYRFFSVQHVLISFTDEILDQLKATSGYDTSKDAELRKAYEQFRADLVASIGIDNLETTYRDEKTGLTVKDADGKPLKITIGEIRTKFEQEYNAQKAELEAKEEYQAMSTDEQELAVSRIRTLLFNKYAWIYSGDTGSLTNDKLSGVLGFTISSESNNHGSFVKDFTNGARALYKNYTDETNPTKIGEEISYVVSDYGVHMMMLTGEYTPGKIIETENKTDAEIVAMLKANYVSNLTEETLYQYVYDIIKNKTVGDNGTFYSDYRNSLIKSYTDAGKIVYKNKMTYKELSDSIN